MKNTDKDHSALALDAAISDLFSIGDYIRVSQYINCNFSFPQSFSLKDFLVIYLKKGTLSGKTNGVVMSYSAPCMITLSAANTYEYQSSTPDADALVISFSPEFTNQLNIFNRFQLNEMFVKNPSLPLNSDTIATFEMFVDKLMHLGKNPQNPYISDAVLHLVLYFFYSIGYYFYQANHGHSRAQQIVEEFLSLLDKYGTEKRNISFYANQLHLSAKYVQIIIKRTTGRSAYAWIEDALLNEAKRLLTENKITVQQIANQLKFCDQSYFGAWFKQKTGVTPLNYRNKILS